MRLLNRLFLWVTLRQPVKAALRSEGAGLTICSRHAIVCAKIWQRQMPAAERAGAHRRGAGGL
ncbi:MAG: hypothetical protein MUC60_07260 [Oscillatoria sp. Prado101]|nr:hypothetical protein [Oscillatoria sp. Prado101]